MKFFADIQIMPLKELQDPQGNAVASRMPHLGIEEVTEIRIGKKIEMSFEAVSEKAAKELDFMLAAKLRDEIKVLQKQE